MRRAGPVVLCWALWLVWPSTSWGSASCACPSTCQSSARGFRRISVWSRCPGPAILTGSSPACQSVSPRSIHRVAKLMAGRLAAVPELSTASFTPPCPHHNPYRESIRSVARPLCEIKQSLVSQYNLGGSSHSSDSASWSSYPSINSGYSTGSASDVVNGLGAYELMRIARQMVSDGYTQRMVQAFEYSWVADRVLETWFFELNFDWILSIHKEKLQDKSVSCLQDLVERWVRALIVIVVSITDLVVPVDEISAVARFGKASMTNMVIFVDAIISVSVLKADKLRAMLDMYMCVSHASNMFTLVVISLEAQTVYNEIRSMLDKEGNRLIEAICNMMQEVRTLMEEDDSWAIEIPRGGGNVHRNTRFMVDCIVSMRRAEALTKDSALSHNTGNLCDLIDDTIDYLKDLLMRKSNLCSDPSLRYMFLLNNSSFMAKVFDTSVLLDYELLPGDYRLKRECEMYMDKYLDVSWGHVFCIPKTKFSGPLHSWNKKSSSLAKFESAFQKTYQAQKFWKVPDPQIRYELRRSIAERFISVNSCYLTELEKHVSGRSNSLDVLLEMLGELSEG